MWTFIIIASLIAVLAIIAVRLALVRRTPTHEPQREVIDPSAAEQFPEPGQESPHRPDGSPIPGSRDDRRAKRPDLKRPNLKRRDDT